MPKTKLQLDAEQKQLLIDLYEASKTVDRFTLPYTKVFEMIRIAMDFVSVTPVNDLNLWHTIVDMDKHNMFKNKEYVEDDSDA